MKGEDMNPKLETKIQKEIRRRAFERADRYRQKQQLRQKTQHTLVALQEVTGLPRPELDSIAEDIKRSLQVNNEFFFSIKTQILITLGVSAFILILSWCGHII